MNNIIQYKIIVRVGGGCKPNLKKEVNVLVIPTCKTCSKRNSECAKNNIVCEGYSLLHKKKKNLGALEKILKGNTSSVAINKLESFYHIDKVQAIEYYNKWRYDYVRSEKEW